MGLMKKKTTKPKLVLLDADIVIKAYEIGVWSELIDRVQIVVTSIVARDEALFYSKELGKIPEEINLLELIKEGKISELTASNTEISILLDNFDRVFIEGLHKGEVEALALIYSGKALEYNFCSGDKVAIQGLAMIGYSYLGISMEKLLYGVGLQKKLSHGFTDLYFKKWLKIGNQRFVTKNGLNKSKK
jgi:hypothetical protein